jgi:hypothetical protein
MGPPAAPELFGVGQHASDRDRGQQPCAVAGRQRVASLEVQAEPGPAAPDQCGGLVPVGGGAVRGGGELPGQQGWVSAGSATPLKRVRALLQQLDRARVHRPGPGGREVRSQ